MKSIEEIKKELASLEENKLSSFLLNYQEDGRMGVKRLVESVKKRLEKYQKELIRMEEMRKIEKEFSNCSYICGVDEVGRGPLAGPVVAAAVILPKDLLFPYINDSKKLSSEKREDLYRQIQEKAISIGIGRVDNLEIDEINILNATMKAMKMAIDELSVKPDMVLVDGNKLIPNLLFPQKVIIKGDAKSISIAAASIIAKVTRDREMVYYDKIYPIYGFASNKGYGSKKHYEGLNTHGLCPLHRRSFIHV